MLFQELLLLQLWVLVTSRTLVSFQAWLGYGWLGCGASTGAC